MSTFRRLAFTSLLLAIPLIAAAADQPADSSNADTQHAASLTRNSPLVNKVRAATARFKDINVALGEGWVRGTPCVSGPNSGAMGVHYIQPDRVGDGVLNANEPEALIYEPLSNSAFELVGVEFIVLAADWEKKNPGGGPPALDGHLTNYVGEPNRYGLPAFYELHVWAWERNPNGNYADWNTQVTCDRQPAS
jgi:hypothetical protein